MSLPVSLMAVVDALDMSSDEITAYINRKTGEIVPVSDSDFYRAEMEDEDEDGEEDGGEDAPEWIDEMVEDARRVAASDDFVALPDRFEIGEWQIMARFCDTVTSERLRDTLNRAIQGRGAFRRFKDRAFEAGVIDDWYRYHEQAMREIAADFLTGEGIPFDPDKPAIEDLLGGSAPEDA